jgi:hypothetical protein
MTDEVQYKLNGMTDRLMENFLDQTKMIQDINMDFFGQRTFVRQMTSLFFKEHLAKEMPSIKDKIITDYQRELEEGPHLTTDVS